MFVLPSNRVNNSFSIFVLLIALWQTIEGLMRLMSNEVDIENWYKTSNIIALFVIPFGILFTLNLYKSNKRKAFKKLLAGLLLPSILISFYVHNSNNLVEISKSNLFVWNITPNLHLANIINYSWLALTSLVLTSIMLKRFFNSGKDHIQKMQSITLSIGFIIPYVVGLIFELIFPFILNKEVIPLTATVFTCFSISAIVAIKKYSLLDFSPINHMDLIMDSLDESLLIIDKNDKIMYANESFCQMIDKKFIDIQDTPAYLYFVETHKNNTLNQLIEHKKNNHIRLKNNSDESTWLMFSGSYYKDPNGFNIGQIVLFTNINTIKMAKQNLAEERQKLKMAIEAVKMATFEIDLQNGSINFSENATELMGIADTYNEFDKLFNSTSYKGQQLSINKLLTAVLESLQMDIHFDFKRPDNNLMIHLEMKGSVVYDKQSSNVSIKGVIVDVSQKWKTEQELENRTELLKTIFDNEPECVKVLGLDGELLEINPAGIDMLEAESKEMVYSRELTSFVHPLDKKMYAENFVKVRNGHNCKFEFRIITFNNHIKWVESNLVPLRSLDGTITSILNVTRNINDIRLKNEEMLKMTRTLEKSESRLKQAQSIAHLGSWKVNLIDGSSEWTDEAYRIYGIEPGPHNISFDEWISYVHEDDRDYVLNEVDKANETRAESHFHYRIIRKDGEIRYLNNSSIFEFDAQNRPIYLIGTVLDETESKLSEIKLRRLLEVTEKQNKRLQNFAYIVSHNIRSHSANISGLTELMEYEKPDNLTKMLKSSADKLSETIENLNSIITIQNEANKHFKEVNLFEKIHSTLDSINGIIEDANAKIIVKMDPLFTIQCVPSYVESIFLNIITNAIKYRQRSLPLEINIQLKLKEEFAVVSICDNGIGIDLDKHGKNIFGLYKTFHGNLDAKGLGLYITRNQIEAMHGKIEVESEVGKGTCFHIYFNLHEAEIIHELEKISSSSAF